MNYIRAILGHWDDGGRAGRSLVSALWAGPRPQGTCSAFLWLPRVTQHPKVKSQMILGYQENLTQFLC